MAKSENRQKQNENPGGLFIPAGVLLGLGFGFLFNNIAAGLFIGLGSGFVGFAVSEFAMKKKKK
ncbi:MAG: hypothetical protein PHW96_02225 [Candidatus Nanoarchaeia archaeon]|nr:hypothetical protein [Candidatus Nanoarchaeia archaeon]